MLLQQELERCKERINTFESKTIMCSKYKDTCDELESEIRADKDTTERLLKEKDQIERVGSSNNVTRPKSKDTESKNIVLKNTNSKSSSAYVRKTQSSVRMDSNKHETINSNECQSNKSVLNTKTVNAVNDDSNLICVFCVKDVFLLSHEKCVARYALSKDSRVKIALFTTSKAAKYRSLGVSSVGAKSRFSIAETPTATISESYWGPKNIKEAMLDHSWIESMQDELNQFKRIDVWELVPLPEGKHAIKVKWLWKNKIDAKNTVIQNNNI
nr:Gag-Pol polyprotein [Tanacetum cinerariifolium]